MSKKYLGKSTYVESYKKELARIKRQISSMKNRGYIISEDIIPKTPKNITAASVRNLKKITSKSLYEKAQYYNEDAQEIISGKVARGYERRTSAQKGQITKEYNEIEDYYSDLIDQLNPTEIPLEDIVEHTQEYYDDEDYEQDWKSQHYDFTDESEPPTIDDADRFREGSINIIESVRERLRELPFIFYTREGRINLTDSYLDINRLFDERVASYEGVDYDICAAYLNGIISELDSVIDRLMTASDSNVINSCYSNLYRTIKGMPLSRVEAEQLGEASDTTDEWDELE